MKYFRITRAQFFCRIFERKCYCSFSKNFYGSSYIPQIADNTKLSQKQISEHGILVDSYFGIITEYDICSERFFSLHLQLPLNIWRHQSRYYLIDHNVWKLLKNVSLLIIPFRHFSPIFVLLKLTCLATLFDRQHSHSLLCS